MEFLRSIPWRYWIIIFACAVIVYLSYSHALDIYELITYDARFRLRPTLKNSSDTILIEISDDTLKNLGKWPLPRDFHVALIKVLKSFGARQIVFDILFSETQDYDETFAHAINAAGNVKLATAFYPDDARRKANLAVEAKKILAGPSLLLEQSKALKAHINISVDADGKVRRLPLFIKYADNLYPSLGLAAALDCLGLNQGRVEFQRGKVVIGEKLILPVLPGAAFLVNYPDIWVKSFTHLSYFQVLKAYTDLQSGKQPVIDLSILKGKTCFIGLTATGTVDLRPTPLESVYPMLGLQASVYNSIMQQKFITAVGNSANALLGICVFILSFILCFRLAPWKSLLANLILGIIFFCASTCLFVFLGVWVGLFLPILIIALTYIGSTLYKLIEENKKRLLLEKELEIARNIQQSFLPKNIESFSGLSISCFLQPAKFVAGDFYDIVPLDEKRLGVLIGDVAGKGAAASLIMAQTISLFRVFCRSLAHPAEVLRQLNFELFQKFSGRFVTSAYVIIDTEKKNLLVSCAGHHPFLIFRKSPGQVIEAKVPKDIPLGLEANPAYQDETLALEQGDRIVLFTDGLLEARNRQKCEFGADNLKETITANAHFSANALLEKIKERVFRFCVGMLQHDDITLIIISFDN